RRQPDDQRRHPAADLRRLGACLLHRLPQPASEVRRGLLEPGQLGLRGEELRRLSRLTIRSEKSPAPAGLFRLRPSVADELRKPRAPDRRPLGTAPDERKYGAWRNGPLTASAHLPILTPVLKPSGSEQGIRI